MINLKQNMIQPSDMRSENILKEHEKKQGKIHMKI